MERKITKTRLVGKRFGKLTVIEFDSFGKGQKTKWKCLCDCGNTKVARNDSLICGHTKSCGCLNKQTAQNHPSWKGYGHISGGKWQNLQKGAASRNLEFSITIQQAWEIFEKQKGICPISGKEIALSGLKSNASSTASLDRIDSKKGYVIGNVWWVHKDVNIMKWDFTLEYFLEMANQIAKFNAIVG